MRTQPAVQGSKGLPPDLKRRAVSSAEHNLVYGAEARAIRVPDRICGGLGGVAVVPQRAAGVAVARRVRSADRGVVARLRIARGRLAAIRAAFAWRRRRARVAISGRDAARLSAGAV